MGFWIYKNLCNIVAIANNAEVQVNIKLLIEKYKTTKIIMNIASDNFTLYLVHGTA